MRNVKTDSTIKSNSLYQFVLLICPFSIVKNEMNELMVQSSPVWQFYEPDVDENQVKCIECDKVTIIFFRTNDLKLN